MRHLFTFALLLVLAPLSLAGPLDDALRSSVQIAEDGSGSVIKADGELLILTAAHVVSSAAEPRFIERLTESGGVIKERDRRPLKIAVATQEGKVTLNRTAVLVWYDRSVDLALLRPSCSKNLHPVALADKEDVERGEDCWYCGLGSGVPFNLTRAIVNRDSVARKGRDYLMVNGEGWYGHSGSGVLVKRGAGYRLQGVVVMLAALDTPRPPLLAVRLPEIKEHIASYVAHKKKGK